MTSCYGTIEFNDSEEVRNILKEVKFVAEKYRNEVMIKTNPTF